MHSSNMYLSYMSNGANWYILGRQNIPCSYLVFYSLHLSSAVAILMVIQTLNPKPSEPETEVLILSYFLPASSHLCVPHILG